MKRGYTGTRWVVGRPGRRWRWRLIVFHGSAILTGVALGLLDIDLWDWLWAGVGWGGEHAGEPSPFSTVPRNAV